MLVLIDESGDAGFKLDKGSSSYFVVTMTIFSDFAEAEKCSVVIKQLQIAQRIFPEFKFSGCRDIVRDQFFETLRAFDFRIYAMVVPKDSIYSRTLKSDSEKFYNFFVRQLLSYHANLLKNAHVKIDESGDKRFKRELANYIRRMIPRDQIKKITFKKSKNDHLIQLADMVTGAIARAYTSKKDHARWHNMIFSKIDNLWKFK
jgi:hypothetical protein